MIVVSTWYGLVYFRELWNLRARALFFLAALTVLLGAVLLAGALR